MTASATTAVVQPRGEHSRHGCGSNVSLRHRAITQGLFELVDLVKFVLEVDAAKEEGHDGA